MQEYLTLFDRYGVSLCMLVAAGYFFRRMILWLSPRIDLLINAHVGFVTTTGEQVIKQTTCLETLADNQQTQGQMIQQIHQKVHGA